MPSGSHYSYDFRPVLRWEGEAIGSPSSNRVARTGMIFRWVDLMTDKGVCSSKGALMIWSFCHGSFFGWHFFNPLEQISCLLPLALCNFNYAECLWGSAWRERLRFITVKCVWSHLSSPFEMEIAAFVSLSGPQVIIPPEWSNRHPSSSATAQES